jgi:predicted tellurium resistance membrane protein TerC
MNFLQVFTEPAAWVSLLTLSAMEIVLGIDNIIFISILAGKLPKAQQAKARQLGLVLALGTRILLLFALSWMMRLTKPLFEMFDHSFSGRDLILLGGGLFLVAKATYELHDKLEVKHEGPAGSKKKSGAQFGLILVQILLLDIVFSLDSVITAVGMAQHLPVMVTAMIVAVGVMLVFAGPVSNFVDHHPTMKVLALSFLLLIGVTLVADGFGQHISKGYIYFAMAFSVFVEVINLRVRKTSEKPIALPRRYEDMAKQMASKS